MNQVILENRLIQYSVSIINFTKSVTQNYAGTHLSNQLIRSGTSVALNYGEARSAESKRDFNHKLRIVLKEFRESHNCLRIMDKSGLHKNQTKMDALLKETNELISILVSTLKKVQNRAA